jgi:hypothetical protein
MQAGFGPVFLVGQSPGAGVPECVVLAHVAPAPFR